MDDLWPNPLQYYVRKKAPAEGTERRAGETPGTWVLKLLRRPPWDLGVPDEETAAQRNALEAVTPCAKGISMSQGVRCQTGSA